MIPASRKDLTEAIKWSKKNSPVAYLVFSMNGKWGTANDNAVNIVTTFEKLWPAARSHIRAQARMNPTGRLRLGDLSVAYPNQRVHKQIVDDFFSLLFFMNKYLDEAEEFAFMESFSRDLLDLFVWDRDNEDIWTGSVLYAADKQEHCEEAERMYDALGRESEKIAALYSLSLLQRCDTDRAAKVLEPYRNSEDETVRQRISLLDRLRAVWGETTA